MLISIALSIFVYKVTNFIAFSIQNSQKSPGTYRMRVWLLPDVISLYTDTLLS